MNSHFTTTLPLVVTLEYQDDPIISKDVTLRFLRLAPASRWHYFKDITAPFATCPLVGYSCSVDHSRVDHSRSILKQGSNQCLDVSNAT